MRKGATCYLKAICIETQPRVSAVKTYKDILVAELSGILKHYILRMAQQHDAPWSKNTFLTF
jgi:hypothetical protein